MEVDPSMKSMNADKSSRLAAAVMTAVGNGLQETESGLPPGLLHDDGMDASLGTDNGSAIPTPVAQHGMMCDDRYLENIHQKYKTQYDKYDAGMDFAQSQRYLSDMNMSGHHQGQLMVPSIGSLHGLKADPTTAAYATLASHPFSIQRLLPGAGADAKADVKMFDMGPYGGYASLGSGSLPPGQLIRFFS